jgi:phosphoadenosine phosphosulfate reductase
MSASIPASFQQLAQQLQQAASPEAALRLLAGAYSTEAVFSTSFGMEDQVVSHLIFSVSLPLEVFTLDTGRLFPETYSTWSRTLEKYQQPIKVYYPDAAELENFVSQKGPNAFYESVELRKACCHIRKVAPLKRALAGKKVWITGIRAAQSANRYDMPAVEWDAAHEVLKYHPLLQWSDAGVKNFIAANNVPYNPLHDRGFVSIGCAPCTRAVKPGEDFRAGRWWWEDADKKECGLHVHESSVATT